MIVPLLLSLLLSGFPSEASVMELRASLLSPLSLFHMLLIFLFFSSLFLSRELPQSLRENDLLFLCAAAGISLI